MDKYNNNHLIVWKKTDLDILISYLCTYILLDLLKYNKTGNEILFFFSIMLRLYTPVEF